MHGPKPPLVTRTADERQGLDRLVRRHTPAQQRAIRARIILAAADGYNNAQIARQLAIDVDTVRLWRQRWLGLQGVGLDDLSVADRLTDAPRPGHPARITAEPVGQIVALACEAPSTSGRPISQWTSREMAEAIRQRGIVEQISPRHAARLLKKGRCNRTWSGIGSPPLKTPSLPRR
jgi:putative transposase